MSEKKDERDIDEILASLDAMLAESQASSSTTDTQKEVVDQATHDSEEKSPVSSSTSRDEISDKNTTQEEYNREDSPPQRIMLTEAYLEPAAQESIPLWAVQHKLHHGESESTSPEIKVNAAIARSNIESEVTTLTDRDESFALNIAKTNTVDMNAAISDNNEDSLASEEVNSISAIAITKDEKKKSEESNVQQDVETTLSQVNETDEFDAVFEAIAEDNTITFDISEAMNEHTLYDIESLDSELVEALVNNVAHEGDLDFKQQYIEDSLHKDNQQQTIIAEEPIHDDIMKSQEHREKEVLTEKNNPKHDTNPIQQQDCHQVDIEPEPHSIISSHETDDPERHEETDTPTGDTITLNPDELDPLIEAICDDVRIKINQHLQQVLPELISEALLEHIANQRESNQD